MIRPAGGIHRARLCPTKSGSCVYSGVASEDRVGRVTGEGAELEWESQQTCQLNEVERQLRPSPPEQASLGQRVSAGRGGVCVGSAMVMGLGKVSQSANFSPTVWGVGEMPVEAGKVEVKTMNAKQQWYQDYLQSDHWRDLRGAKLLEAGFRCQKCGKKSQLQVHHKTYERVSREKLSDLEVLCDPCHFDLHSKELSTKFEPNPSYNPKVRIHPMDRRRQVAQDFAITYSKTIQELDAAKHDMNWGRVRELERELKKARARMSNS